MLVFRSPSHVSLRPRSGRYVARRPSPVFRPSCRSILVGVTLVTVSLAAGEVEGQSGLPPQTTFFIDHSIESQEIQDDTGRRVTLYSMTGWASDDNLKSRILGTWTRGGMAVHRSREEQYQYVLRAMVLQDGLGELDRLGFLAAAAGSLSNPEFLETVETLLLAGELSITTVNALNDLGLLDAPVREMVQAAEALGFPAVFASGAELVDGLEHLGSALTAVGALAGGISVARDIHAQVRTAVLWQALDIDLAIARIEAVRRSSNLEDPAFLSALEAVESDLRRVPTSIWGEMYRAGIRDPDVLLGTGMGITSVTMKLASMAGASGKVMPWVGAALFSTNQVRLAADHRRDLQRMTAAATVYRSLDLLYLEPFLVESMESLQEQFLAMRRSAFDNWAYGFVWRNVSRSWRELTEIFEEDHRAYRALVVERRLMPVTVALDERVAFQEDLEPRDDLIEDVVEFLEDYFRAWNTGEGSAIRALFHPQSPLLPVVDYWLPHIVRYNIAVTFDVSDVMMTSGGALRFRFTATSTVQERSGGNPPDDPTLTRLRLIGAMIESTISLREYEGQLRFFSEVVTRVGPRES